MPPAPSRPALFVDRDGVINRKAAEPHYVRTWEEFSFLPGARGALARVAAATDLLIVVVTNQRGVARGIVDPGQLERMHREMTAAIEAGGGRIDGIYCCTHDRDEGCDCRKPEPGLLLRAAADHGIDLGRSWLVGDRESDIIAAQRAGCGTTVRVAAPDAEDLDPWRATPDHTVADLGAAVALVVAAAPRALEPTSS